MVRFGWVWFVSYFGVMGGLFDFVVWLDFVADLLWYVLV